MKMNFKVLFVLGLVAVVAVQADENDKECIEKSNVDQKLMEVYEKGAGVVPEHDRETEEFLLRRYGHTVDNDNKLIINDETTDELANTVAAKLKLHKMMAITVAKHIMHSCQVNEANSKSKAIVKIGNCISREMEEYIVANAKPDDK